MLPGDWLTRGSAWIAFACWLLAVTRNSRAPTGHGWWLAGAVALLVHTAFAFHFQHHWSHALAVADTARQTRELTGLDWGGGLWLNYLVVVVWLGDALWRMTTSSPAAGRPRWLTPVIHGFLGFIWFNATVVFGSPGMRLAGIVAFLWLTGTHVRSFVGSRRSPTPDKRDS